MDGENGSFFGENESFFGENKPDSSDLMKIVKILQVFKGKGAEIRAPFPFFYVRDSK